jgi:Resolvase, N terminal domain
VEWPVLMAHVLAYLRVSKQEQAESGAGLAAQRASILREAERRGWAEADLEWITDAGFTGRSLRRPGVVAALAMLKSRKADTLVVSKADRLSRSMEDFTRIMADATRERWALVALDMNLDMTTAEGELQATCWRASPPSSDVASPTGPEKASRPRGLPGSYLGARGRCRRTSSTGSSASAGPARP